MAEILTCTTCEGGAYQVPVKLLSPGAKLPERAYEHDAAYDLYAAEGCVIEPLRRAVVGTGLALGLPPGLAALTLPRSGLAARHGISIVNTPGLIDPGYRGEVRIILLNTDQATPFTVEPGDRIAQLLFVPLTAVTMGAVADLDVTQRGAQGFGSSGTGQRP
jgi:dUTP pyrophosphatase